jgi:hypothetical protein
VRSFVHCLLTVAVVAMVMVVMIIVELLICYTCFEHSRVVLSIAHYFIHSRMPSLRRLTIFDHVSPESVLLYI